MKRHLKFIKRPPNKLFFLTGHSKIDWVMGLVLLSLLVGCMPSLAEDQAITEHTITVYAASSLTDAFSEIAMAFEAQNPETAVLLNFAGSSQLAAQLHEGMVGEVFASANPAQMAAVIDSGRVTPGSETVFVSNQLTIIVPVDNPAAINAFEDLANPNVDLILAGEGVPVRSYTAKIIATMPPHFQDQFYRNLVSEEDNVRRVAAKIALGEADAGIVYTTDITPDIASKVQQIQIPADQNFATAYTIAPLNDAPHPELAAHFIDFVNNAEGQSILAKFGFNPPSEN
ncbi:MAG: molybdate ABC transporter substrate-binding protein [Anaerolineales bacterium]|nr:molybdate ABC transporter substrate-binding protein [Anaerolineales bacterium]